MEVDGLAFITEKNEREWLQPINNHFVTFQSAVLIPNRCCCLFHLVGVGLFLFFVFACLFVFIVLCFTSGKNRSETHALLYIVLAFERVVSSIIH